VGSTKFDEFCDTLRSTFGRVSSSSLQLPYEHPERMVDVGEGLSLDISVLNYGKWIKRVGTFGFFGTANAHLA